MSDVRSMAAVFAALALCACESGRFPAHDLGTGTLRGHAIATYGTRAGIRVYAISNPDDPSAPVIRVEGATDDDGVFELADVPSGAITLVLNDGHGEGDLRTISVEPLGENDAGDIYLQSLSEFPTMALLRDVGFEELLTFGFGNLVVTPIWSADGASLFTVLDQTGFLDQLLLVQYSTEGDALQSTAINRPEVPGTVPTMQRFGDDLLYFDTPPASTLQAPPAQFSPQVFDSKLGDVLYTTGAFNSIVDAWIDGGDLFVIGGYAAGGLTSAQYGYHLVRYELAGPAELSQIAEQNAGEPVELLDVADVPLFPLDGGGDDLQTVLPLALHDGQQLIFGQRHACADHPANCPAPDAATDPGATDLFRVDLGTMARTPLGITLGDWVNAGPALTPPAKPGVGSVPALNFNVLLDSTEDALYFVRAPGPATTAITDAYLTRVDLTTGAQSDLSHGTWSTPLGTVPIPWLLFAGSNAAFELDVAPAPYDMSGNELGITTATAHRLPLFGESALTLPLAPSFLGLDGPVTYSLCSQTDPTLTIEGLPCLLTGLPDGGARLFANPASYVQVSVDFASDGTIVRQRLLNFYIPGVPELHPIFPSPDGSLEAVVLPTDALYQQIALDDASQGYSRFAQATWFGSNKTPIGWTQDSAWFLYLAPDPNTGMTQIFRVARP